MVGTGNATHGAVNSQHADALNSSSRNEKFSWATKPGADYFFVSVMLGTGAAFKPRYFSSQQEKTPC